VAREKGLLTSGTFGPPSSGTSTSASLTDSLGSRLAAETGSSGSTLYALTWKMQATPAGRLFFLLRASVRRTSGIGSGGAQTGWPSPVAQDDNKTVEAHLAMKKRMGERDGSFSNRTSITSLQVAAQTAGWSTPKAEDAQSTGFSAARLAAGKIPDNLHSQSLLAIYLGGWASPAARDYRTPTHRTYEERGGGKKGEQLNNKPGQGPHGASLNGSPAATGGKGLLNPRFSSWLQGYPPIWDMLAPKRSGRATRKK